MSDRSEAKHDGQVEKCGRGKRGLLAIFFAGIALLVRPPSLLAQAAASVQIRAEVMVLPDRELIEQGLRREPPLARMAVDRPLAASDSALLVQGNFVRIAIQREADILRTRIDFIAN